MSERTLSTPLDTRLARFRDQPDTEEASRLAQDLLNAMRTKDALEVTRLGQEQHPEDARLYIVEGKASLREGDLTRSQTALAKALELNPNDKDTLRWLGEVYLKCGEPIRASEVLERAKQLDPGDLVLRSMADRASRLSRIAEGSADASRMKPLPKAPETKSPMVPAAKLPALRAPQPQPQAQAQAQVREEVSRLSIPPAPFPLADDLPLEANTPFDDEEDAQTRVSQVANTAAPRDSSRPPPIPPRVRMSSRPPPPPAAAMKALAEENLEDGEIEALDLEEGPTMQANPAEAFPALAFPSLTPARVPSPKDFTEEDEAWLSASDSKRPPPQPGFDDLDWSPPDLGMLNEKRVASRKRWKIAAAVLVALVALGVGGWQFWRHQQQAIQAQSIARAAQLARLGDYPRLLEANQLLEKAKRFDPENLELRKELLFVEMLRSFEDVKPQAERLRGALVQAQKAQVPKSWQSVAQASLSFLQGNVKEARKHWQAWEKEANPPSETIFIAALLERRIGESTTLKSSLEALTLGRNRFMPAVIVKALVSVDQGRLADAQQAMKSLVKRDKSHVRAQLIKLWTDIQTVAPEQTKRELKRFASRESSLGAPDRALIALIQGSVAAANDQNDLARLEFEKASQFAARHPTLLRWVGKKAEDIGEPTFAIQRYEQALTLAPNYAAARKDLARLHLKLHQGQQALEVLQAVASEEVESMELSLEAALQTADPAVLNHMLQRVEQAKESAFGGASRKRAWHVRLLLALNQKDAALKLAQEGFDVASTDAHRHLALAEAMFALGDVEGTEKALQRVLELSLKEDAHFYALLGHVAWLQKGAAHAEEFWAKALLLNPEQAEIELALANLFVRTGKWQAAETVYKKFEGQEWTYHDLPVGVVAQLGLIEISIAQERFSETSTLLNTIPEAQRAVPRVLELSVAAKVAQGQGSEALEELKPLLSAAPRSTVWLTLQADALSVANQWADARDVYNKVLELEPASLRAGLGRANVDIYYESLGQALERLTELATLLSKEIHSPRDEAEVWLLIGRSRLAQGRKYQKEAQIALKKAAQFEGAPSEVYFRLGQALLKTQRDEAKEAFRHCVEQFPEGRFFEQAQKALQSL